jgi:ribosomal-protein-serine acetyltransferase
MKTSDAPSVHPPERIVVGDLVLERWMRSDIEALFDAISASLDHLLLWMGWASRHDRASVAQFLADSEAGWGSGDRFEYAIRDPRGEVVGSAGLMRRIGSGGLEIGYWVHSAYLRKGFATRASWALTEAALTLEGIDHVEIHHDEANFASGAVPARLGFSRIGTFPAKPLGLADVGRDVRWRMSGEDFRNSRTALGGSPAM